MENFGLFIIYASGGIGGSQYLTSFLEGPVYAMCLNLEQKPTYKS